MTEPAQPAATRARPSVGFWRESWRRFRRRRLSMAALSGVVAILLVGFLSPAIIGARPIVCQYQGRIYLPCLAYYTGRDPAVFAGAPIYLRYSPNLAEHDPDGWAVWPLIFQDPERRVREGEWPHQPGNPTGNLGRPQWPNLLGTDQAGVDVLAQLLHGARTAMLVGFVSTGIAAAIGITIGALAGYFGGWIDIALSRFIEVVMCVPTLVLILFLIAIIEQPQLWHMMAVIGATGWTGLARLTRGEFLKLRNLEYVMAAQALGAGHARIMFRHMLPNALAPVLVPIAFGIANAILIETGLSFLGFGAPPPTPSWGRLLNAGFSNLQMWWLLVFPGLAIFTSVLCYNLIGEGIQESTDPRLRQAAHH